MAMGNGPKKWTEKEIALRLRAGRGQGQGATWKPWIYVQEFSSSGVQTRLPSAKLRRTVHTMSYLELFMFFFHEYQLTLMQYFEQFPADRSVTLAAAQALGIKHPVYRDTKVPVVMTIDAISTHMGDNGRPQQSGWDAKPARLLKNRRVLEKLSLHRAYCAHIGIPHHIFTEDFIPKSFVRNVIWMRDCEQHEGELLPTGFLEAHRQVMLTDLAERRPKSTIGSYCRDYDNAYRLTPGTARRVFGLLLWRVDVKTDLAALDVMSLKLPLPAVPASSIELKKAA
jgi:hypothetical protein